MLPSDTHTLEGLVVGCRDTYHPRRWFPRRFRLLRQQNDTSPADL